MEQFLATVKYYITHPDERPSSGDGWGNASDHVRKPTPSQPRGENEQPSDEEDKNVDEEENNYRDDDTEDESDAELDEYEKEQKSKADAMGMSLADFRKALYKVATKYSVSAEKMTFDTAAKTVSFTAQDGSTKVVNFLTGEEITSANS